MTRNHVDLLTPPRTYARAKLSMLKSRRGIVSVLAMMFLILFSSLGLAMTIASRGNLRTASTSLQVNRALGAAETGLAVARARIIEAASRFVVDIPAIDAAYGPRLWDGTLTTAQGRLPVILPATSGFVETGTPRGIAQALMNHFGADMNVISEVAGTDEPRLMSAPSGVDNTVYRTDSWVTTPAVGIDGSATAAGSAPAAFSIMFAPLANGTDIRIFATGYSSVNRGRSGYIYGGTAADHGNTAVTRTIWQDFRLVKRHRHLAVTPAKLMIGKNVSITGDLGVAFTDVTAEAGDPVVIKSDFYGLNTNLDRILNDFFTGVRQRDVDGDLRLRVGHPVESLGLPSAATDYDGDGQPDNAFSDASGDGYVDDYDLFINFFDGKNGGIRDGRVMLSDALRAGTPTASMTAEFTVDDDLAIMIDSVDPDRNRNGILGYEDANSNGRWESAETMNDRDAANGNAFADQVLGYRDGALDRRDNYAKLRGRLLYRTSRAALAAARPNFASALAGSIGTIRQGDSPQNFSAAEGDLPNLTAADFAPAVSDYRTRSNGGTFARQVETARGLSSGAVATNGATSAHVETRPRPASSVANPPARYFPSNMDNSLVRGLTGQNKWEKTPFSGPSFNDYYIRPRYENMTFTNVTIPRGNNGLFVKCTFVGVTFVDTETSNSHQNWQLYGRLSTTDPAAQPTASSSPLDKSDFARWTSGNVVDGPANYSDFPDPPRDSSGAFITGASRDTKPRSNNLRFHDCLFVGTVATASPTIFTHVRNKMMFTGATRFVSRHPTEPSNPALNVRTSDQTAVSRSSLMAPGYSVDIGHFNAPTDTFAGGPAAQNVNLTGTIVAGLLDVRGTASIEGTLLATFKPTLGEAPLLQYGLPVGNPANFNVSLGYFGPADGDIESVDPTLLPTGPSGRRIVGWDLDGDGMADTAPMPLSALTVAQRTTAVEVPFYGYGRISMRWNPDLPMPPGIMLPVSIMAVRSGYGEGKPQ